MSWYSTPRPLTWKIISVLLVSLGGNPTNSCEGLYCRLSLLKLFDIYFQHTIMTRGR